MTAPLLYLIAGEASGDALGADLMRGLKRQQPDIRFTGIGGPLMQAEGLQSLFPMHELSIMGFFEILPHIPHMLRRIRETVADIEAKQPAALVTIDSPGFTFRVARKLLGSATANKIPRIHYVAPSVWAYKPGRALKTAKLYDLLLTLLPFEPSYFEKEGLKTVFVGHPVLWNQQQGDGAAFRARHGVASDKPVLLVLPGSRRGEVERLLPDFLAAARDLTEFTPVILAGTQVRSMIEELAQGMIIADFTEKTDAFAAANLALTKSGTISLELAQAGVPMVVAHRASAITAWIVRRMILIQYASLANIAANEPIIPELIQENCTVEKITAELKRLAIPDVAKTQKARYAHALKLLHGDNQLPPGDIGARAVLDIIKEPG